MNDTTIDSVTDTEIDTEINKGPDLETRRKRLKFRAWHRGTQEADIIIGSFVDLHFQTFSKDDCVWMERLLEEADIDILNWITGKFSLPPDLDTDIMRNMQKLDYLPDNK